MIHNYGFDVHFYTEEIYTLGFLIKILRNELFLFFVGENENKVNKYISVIS